MHVSICAQFPGPPNRGSAVMYLQVLHGDALHQRQEIADEADVLTRERVQLHARHEVGPVPVHLRLVVVLVDDHLHVRGVMVMTVSH